MSDDKGNRRRGISVPRLDMETERPPSGGDGGDAYSAATVVRSLPDDLLVEMAALRPQKLPAIDDGSEKKSAPAAPEAKERAPDSAATDASPAEAPVAKTDPEEDAPPPADLATEKEESSERPPAPRTGTRGSKAAIDVDEPLAPPKPKANSVGLLIALALAVALGLGVYFATR